MIVPKDKSLEKEPCIWEIIEKIDIKCHKEINLYSQFSLPECQKDSMAKAGV